MIWFRRLLIAIAIFAAVSASMSAPAGAETPQDRKAIRESLSRIYDGSWTEADLDYIRQFPEIAKDVMDPSADATVRYSVREVSALEDPQAVAACSGRAHAVEGIGIKRTLLGFTAFKFHNYATACWSGSTYTAWIKRSGEFTDVDPNFQPKQKVTDSQQGIGTRAVDSTIGWTVENCIPVFGCVGSGVFTLESFLETGDIKGVSNVSGFDDVTLG